MKSLLPIVLTIVSWVLLGIWSYGWLEPEGFLQVVIWLLLWQAAAGIPGLILKQADMFIINRFQQLVK